MADKENRKNDDKDTGFAHNLEDDPEDIEEQFAVGEFHAVGLTDILKSPFGGELAKPFARDIFLRHMPVVGGYHVDGIEELWAALKEEDTVYLVREPQNPADEYAILVLNEDRVKLGYIPRRENRILARLMDAGKLMHAEISTILDMEEYFDPVWIAIYMED